MAFNKNEVLLDRVRSLTCHDLETNKMLLRLTSLEDPSLNTSAEGEEVVDSIGALITTLYRAKKAEFSASNSLVSLDLAAAQYGAKKEIASSTDKITDYTYEILKFDSEITVGENNVGGFKLSYAPLKITGSDGTKVSTLKYAYVIENNEVGAAYELGAAASKAQGETPAVLGFDDTNNIISLPDGMTADKIYVEYQYETENAVRIVNKASEFPQAVSVVIYAYFRDVCNENKIYSGKIICPKAKLSPESVELALTSTGKHPFSFVINRDYCAEEGEDTLFEIILSE